MKELFPDLLQWLHNGESIAIATVIQTWGSSPRPTGAQMAITASAKMSGSVSGGCVEAAVVEAALETLQTHTPQLLHFGVADAAAWEVGLACGGTIEVFVQLLEEDRFKQLQLAVEGDYPAAEVTVIRGPAHLLGKSLVWSAKQAPRTGLPPELEAELVRSAQTALADERAQRIAPGWQEIEVFANILRPSPLLVIVGGVHISVALAKLAGVLGFRVVLVDPRKAFGSSDRFPQVERLIQAWPDEALNALAITPSSAIVVLTHDPKLDDPALLAALPGPAYYVGAIGSAKTQAERRKRLLQAGLSESQLDRLHGPVGLAIGAHSPEEIALAILAEIVAARKNT